jgi:hypothetical protein
MIEDLRITLYVAPLNAARTAQQRAIPTPVGGVEMRPLSPACRDLGNIFFTVPDPCVK